MVKKRLLLVFLLSFYLISVKAEIENTFESKSVISPPPPPEEGREISDKFTVLFQLKDYLTKELINDTHVNIEILEKTTNQKINTLKYVGSNGIVDLRLPEGMYDIALKVDKIGTNGRDYYIKFDQNINSDVKKTVYLFYAGSVIGNVYDMNGNAIKGAQIKLDCSGDYGETLSTVTDDFGSFSFFWLPIGSCRISAVHGNKVAYKDVEIKRGELSSIDITLSKGTFSSLAFGAVILVVLVVIILSFFIKNRKKETKEKKEHIKKEEANPLNSRSNDILKTLNEKEKAVVEFLIQNGYKGTQSKIRYGTGIPKTSLSRVLNSLEFKKVIVIEKIGKLKKVDLTAWFLGKG